MVIPIGKNVHTKIGYLIIGMVVHKETNGAYGNALKAWNDYTNDTKWNSNGVKYNVLSVIQRNSIFLSLFLCFFLCLFEEIHKW